MMIDLRKYILVSMDKSTCPCGRHIFSLMPRSFEPTDEPIIFLCLCGRIIQAGTSVEIAPPEVRPITR